MSSHTLHDPHLRSCRFSMPTKSRQISLSLASIFLGTSLSLAAGCQGNREDKLSGDLGLPDAPINSDPNRLYKWWGISVDDGLISTVGGEPTERNWKRDPHYLADGLSRYLFISNSPSASSSDNFAAEVWEISYYSYTLADANAKDPGFTTFSPWKLAVKGTPGTWYTKDVTAPFARINGGSGAVWFSANGSPSLPNYVLQIGRASFDGTNFVVGTAPVLAAPTFSSTQADATPTIPRPDAYGATDPWLLQDAANPNTLIMYYAGLDCATSPCRFQILRATSNDDGMTFSPGQVVLTGRPGMAIEAGGVAGPSVIQVNGQYAMAYTALSLNPDKTRLGIRKALNEATKIGLAVSLDGITWQTGAEDGTVAIAPHPPAMSWMGSGCGSPSLYVKQDQIASYLSGLAGSSTSIAGLGFSIGTAVWGYY